MAPKGFQRIPSSDVQRRTPWCRSCYVRAMHLVPLLCMLGGLFTVATLVLVDRPMALAVLTVFLLLNCYCFLIHLTVFSALGQLRVSHACSVDFKHLLDNYTSSQAPLETVDLEKIQVLQAAAVAPSDVLHVVLLPNFKEDLDILREALDTIAKSSLAATQVLVVLAMEARESGSERKARQLYSEYSEQFLHILPTFHPTDLLGEMPGKASNTKWAVERLWEYLSKEGIADERVILTIADADSDFHPSYFEALTLNFLQAEPVQRALTVWQPPIMHYKNYHSQPAIVKMASLFVAQYELATLADDTAISLPYSTYSVSSTLAKRVGGWDGDWISEDWHMFLKCFLRTAGAARVVPILLPVVNYTPEDSTWLSTLLARWTQAKRHALGVAEIVYYLTELPKMCRRLPFHQSVQLVLRSLPMLLKMATVHVMVALSFLLSALNGPLLLWVMLHPDETQGHGRKFWLALNFTSGILGSLFFFLLNATGIGLYQSIRSRIVPPEDSPVMEQIYKRPLLHFSFLFPLGALTAPVMGAAGGLAEWVAAFKTASTHKFEYEVAIKPSVSRERLNMDMELVVG